MRNKLFTFKIKITLLFIATLLLISSCSQNKHGVKPPFAIYPYEFYERFNLRSIFSSYDGYLKYYCASYPKDFFTPEEVYMPNTNKVIIENKDKRLVFELFSEDKVIVTDEHFDGSYSAKYLYKIYYNEEHDDFRTDRRFIKKREGCRSYLIDKKEK